MTRFVLSPAAAADLERIAEYLDEHAPHATDRVLRQIRDTLRRLARNPGIGHAREDLADEPLRFHTVWSYLVIYRPDRPIEVVRVLHAARDVVRQLRKP